ncbi:COG4315 family predicted lipoprotein [Arthrobacter sp. MDT2-2]
MGKKLSTSLAGAALTLLALTGCSGSGQEAAETVAAEATEATAETTEAAEPTPAAETSEAATGEATPEASAPAAASPTTLGVATSDLGEIVVDAEGMTVYYFTKDVADSGVSACKDDCLVAWPPVISGTETPEVEGVTGEVGTIETTEGGLQMTINGMPIYYFNKDLAAGDVNGQAVGDVWYVVAPDGTMIQ